MISHQNKCIFVHIPKAAGTSLISVFADRMAKPISREPMPFHLEDNKFDPPPPHLRALDHVKYGLATRQQFDSYFKFAFVRNPWDRLVSEYKYEGLTRKFSFKKFLFEHLPKPRWDDHYCHIIPQYDFIFDEQGNQLVNFIGKFENLQLDFEKVCERIFNSKKKLPFKNKSLSLLNRRDNNLRLFVSNLRNRFSLTGRRNTFITYQEYYDNESVEFVRKLYSKDVETFNYHFD